MAAKQLGVTDVTVERLLIQSAAGKYDLLPHLDELNIYEDIFSNTVRGDITLDDAYNIPYKLPIVGEEIIDCKIKMEGDSGEDKDYRIVNPPNLHVHELLDRYKLVDPDTGLGPAQMQRFSLNFVSEQYISNFHSCVSKAYSGWTIGDIVEDIYNNYLDDDKGFLNITDTAREENIIIPNWHPHDAFNWLARRAQPEASDAVNYVYYEAIDSSNFVSLESLSQVDTVLSIIKTPRESDPHKIEGLSGSFIKADDISFIANNNKLKSIRKGQYASKLITHDILTKQIAQHDYDGLQDFKNYKHLEEWPSIGYSQVEAQVGNTFRTSFAPPLIGKEVVAEGDYIHDMTDSAVSFYPKHNKMYGADPATEYDNKVEDWKLQHSGQMSLYDGITLQVQCAGVSTLRVGQTVEVFMLSAETTSTGEFDVATDKYMSGKYMITSIRHIFKNIKQIEYKMFIELSKDSLNELPTPRPIRKKGSIEV